MLVAAVIPFLGLLALILLSTIALNRRATRLAEARNEADRSRRLIVKRDREGQEELLEEIVEGKQVDQALTAYLTRRGALLPGANEQTPYAWDTDDLDRVLNETVKRASGAVNRRLAFSTSIAAVLLFGTTAVGTLTVYHFQSSRLPALAPHTGVPFGAAASSLDDPFAPGAAEDDAMGGFPDGADLPPDNGTDLPDVLTPDPGSPPPKVNRSGSSSPSAI